MPDASPHYRRPGWFTQHVFNPAIAFLTRRGVSVWGSRVLEVLRAYLRRWKAEVGVFFDGVTADSTDDDIAAIAPRHPVFLLEPIGPGRPEPTPPAT
jgi:hypothetical protein